jgi:hypothetical protein
MNHLDFASFLLLNDELHASVGRRFRDVRGVFIHSLIQKLDEKTWKMMKKETMIPIDAPLMTRHHFVLFYSSQHLVTYNRYFWQSRPLEIKSSIH